MPNILASSNSDSTSHADESSPRDALDLLLRSFRLFQLADSRAIRHEVSALNLNETDVRLIFFLSASDMRGVTPKRVGQYLELSTGAVTGLLDRLERRGYVSRQPNPEDRRSVIVHLSDAGHDVAQTIGDTYREVFLESLDTKQYAALAASFDQITQALMTVATAERAKIA